MGGLTSFFHFCAGANESILKRAPTDSSKYAGIGATIFFTGVFAAIAGGFALHTVFKSVLVAVPFGILWGLMIFNLDRYIVMSIKKTGHIWREIGMATPRILLAVLIAFVIAKPLELKLFESEIKAELVLMEQSKIKQQEDMLKLRYENDINTIKEDIAQLNREVEAKRNVRDELSLAAIQEADGTGGSGKRNLGPIYKAKKAEADQAQAELQSAMLSIAPLLENKQSELTAMTELRASDLLAMEATRLDGFAARLDALGRLGEKSTTILWASIFITLLFMAIETAPLFVKLISSRSPYDYRLEKHESEVALMHHNYVGKLTALSQADLKYVKETERHASLEKINAEKELLVHTISTELDKVKEKQLTWKEYKGMKGYFS